MSVRIFSPQNPANMSPFPAVFVISTHDRALAIRIIGYRLRRLRGNQGSKIECAPRHLSSEIHWRMGLQPARKTAGVYEKTKGR